MPDVKLAGSLPGTTERNGVVHVAQHLIDGPLQRRVALVVYDAPTKVDNAEEGTHTPKIRVRWIEDMGTEAARSDLVEQMNQAVEARTGAAPLPLDDKVEPAAAADVDDESELVD